jgi:hypothetical protein
MLSCKRENQPPPIRQSIQPRFRWLRRTGVHVNDVGGIELHRCAVTVKNFNITSSAQVGARTLYQVRLKLNSSNATGGAHQVRENRCVIASTSSNVHNVLSRLRHSRREQGCVEGWLPIIDFPNGVNRNDIVGV